MVAVLPLLAAAALVGVLHMSAPDHWVTLCVLGQSSRWSLSRLLGMGLVAAVGHVALSVALGLGVVGAGLLVSTQLSSYLVTGTGALMVIGGLGYAVFSIRTSQGPSSQASGPKGMTYFAVLGAALSPDLSILPIFILALPMGLGLVLDAAAVFAVASILALSALLFVGHAGLTKVFARVPEKYNNALVGLVLAAVGAYVLVYG